MSKTEPLVSEPAGKPKGDAELTVDAGTQPDIRGLRRPLTVGESIGRYVVLGQLGRGGMGTVFKAYDQELNRAIAVKLLHGETNERDIERLKREAQALARLSHPNVVHVYEVGQHGDRWFIAMELVDGQTLRRWQQSDHSWQECVRVYRAVGSGLEAAHAEGLLHRDFKPDNCIIDERGRPKVLDFGLVREVDASPDEPSSDQGGRVELEPSSASLTRAGAVVGTVAYMPLEQLNGAAVDARSDQFSFCVSLYEALYGERPFSDEGIGSQISAMTDGDVRAAPPRTHVPMKLRRVLLRGLSARPQERWPSMGALLRELRTIVTPRTRAWVPVMVAITGMIAAVVTWRMVAVQPPCQGASEQLEGVWGSAQRQQVEAAMTATGLAYATKTWSTLRVQLDTYADAWVQQHTDACEATSVRAEQSAETMDRRMRCLKRARVELSAVVTELSRVDHETLEHAHRLVELLPRLTLCSDIAALESEVQPPADAIVTTVESLRAQLAHADTQRAAGRPSAALEVLEALDDAVEATDYGPLKTELWLALGRALDDLGRYDEATSVLKRALRSGLSWRQRDLAVEITTRLAMVVGVEQERPSEGLAYVETGWGLLGPRPDAEQRGRMHDITGNILLGQGRLEEAEAEHQAALSSWKEAPEPEGLQLAIVYNNLAITLESQGHYQEAEEMIQAVLVLREQQLGPEHPLVAMTRVNLGAALSAQGDYVRAEEEVRAAVTALSEARGPEHPNVAKARNNLATILQKTGRYEDAETEYRRVLSDLLPALGPEHPQIAESRVNLGVSLMLQGKYADAQSEYRAALTLLTETLGSDHQHVAMLRANIGTTAKLQGNYAEAEAEYEATLPIMLDALGSEHPHVSMMRANLSDVLERQGKDLDRARSLAEAAWSGLAERDVPKGEQARAAFVLARVLWPDVEQRSRARVLATTAAELFDEAPSSDRDEFDVWRRTHQ